MGPIEQALLPAFILSGMIMVGIVLIAAIIAIIVIWKIIKHFRKK